MVVVIVQIPIAPRARDEAIAQARKSAPTYQALGARGLVRKHYLNGSDGGGGVYFWRTRADAEAWYTPEWRAQMRERFGAEVQDHYTNMARVELDAFGKAVTDWERYRSFERL